MTLFALVGCNIPNICTPSPNSLQTIGFAQDAPDGAAPDTCWGKTISPAIIEAICPNLMTDDFVASLQRALSLRGAYRGKVTGLMDYKTRRAISKFQQGCFKTVI
ncbi:peptidoglycan-binding protein [Ascidiaceihabitans sp.]|nr:peptidoglycan-binding protein [Ascidiaceihabitans sp.]